MLSATFQNEISLFDMDWPWSKCNKAMLDDVTQLLIIILSPSHMISQHIVHSFKREMPGWYL